MTNGDEIRSWLGPILNTPDPYAPARERDRAVDLARHDPVGALALARNLRESHLRAHALAVVARWIDDARVEEVAREALTEAAAAPDPFSRAGLAIWAIRALLERQRELAARAALEQVRGQALAAQPSSSRATALYRLLDAAWALGPQVRWQLVDDLVAVYRADSYWRVEQALVDALHLMPGEDRDAVMRIANGITDAKGLRRALRTLALGPANPSEFFRP